MSNKFDFSDVFNALHETPFDEIPVDAKTFIESEEYLGQPPMSEHQLRCLQAMTQILNLDTLIDIYGEERGRQRYDQTANEIILVLGKGGGKNETTTNAFAYIMYILLCLKNPQKYYGKPTGDDIVLMNIAINADQAYRTFFKKLLGKIERSPWFEGKFDPHKKDIEFPEKNITVISGNSESESLEGYNVLIVVLDEISGFKMATTTSTANSITAESTYDMHRASVTSRYARNGCLVLLSWPRGREDFILKRYEEIIAEKETITKSHKFKLNEELPDNMDANEFAIHWTEDNILQYKYERMFALKRASWEVNPAKTIDEYKTDFIRNPLQALGRFACNPPETIDAFFVDEDKVSKALRSTNGVDAENRFLPDFKPEEGKKYFLHVDLAQKKDRAVVSMAHVNRWITFGDNVGVMPEIIVDVIRWWTPTQEKTVDFKDVREFIMNLRRRGFNIDIVTYDRFGSVDEMAYLKSQGMKSEILSVGLTHFQELSLLVYDERVKIPYIPLLHKELMGLRVVGNRVEHQRTGTDDLAYSMTGAVYNAIKRTHRTSEEEIDVLTYSDLTKPTIPDKFTNDNVIHAPAGTKVPTSIDDFLNDITLI